jgi:hypothetical protein
MMDHRHRLPRLRSAALAALALACVRPAVAQNAPTPAPEALPGVADIDFSLEGREAERAGTPTEGPARPAASASPAAPASEPTTALPPAPHSDAPRRGATGAAPAATRDLLAQGGSAAPQAEAPQGEDAASVPSTPPVLPQAAKPVATAAATSGFPAWPFGLALLAAALWFAFRRRRSGERPADEAPLAQGAEAEAPLPESAPIPAPVQPPEAHPALRVKIPEPVPADIEPVAPPPPPPPARPAIARYDAFGRPIVAQPSAPKPAPAPPPPRPRARIVRYDAMGLPILD